LFVFGTTLNHVVYSRTEPLDRTFAALADPTRRGLIARLAEGPRTVGNLAAEQPISLVAVGKHLTVLERAGIVARARAGRTVVCTLRADALRDAAEWIESYRAFRTERLDPLHRYLGEAL
jgi:DNA-binding transcriptional ArsR family regulator